MNLSGAANDGRTSRRATRAGFAVVFLLAGLALVPGPALGCSNASPGNHHCYALAEFETGGTQIASEGSAYVFLGCIGLATGWENINTDEMWAGMEDGAWIEAGMVTGNTVGGQKLEPNFFVSYWKKGEGESESFYNEHLGGEAPAMTSNLTYLRQETPEHSTTWKGWTAGTGTVTVKGFGSRFAAVSLEAGLETSENEGWNDAAVTNLSYLNWNGNEYTTEWSHGSIHAKPSVSGPGSGSQGMYFTWTTNYFSGNFGYHNHGC